MDPYLLPRRGEKRVLCQGRNLALLPVLPYQNLSPIMLQGGRVKPRRGEMDNNRVVITGLGLVTPLGNDVPTTWDGLVAGRSGVGPITHFDASDYPARIAAEVKEFDPVALFGQREARRMDRFAQFALAAAGQALDDSGLSVTEGNAQRVGAVIGSGIGGIISVLEQAEVLRTRGPRRVSPFLVPMMLPDTAPGQVAIAYGLKGPNFAVISACATGANAIGEAAEVIRRGAADAMLAGGAEAGIVPLALAGFAVMQAISTRNAEPERASRPFDATRDGFVMGEGGGVVVLESEAHARARGARIYAEVVGYGATADAYHMTAPEETGEGAARAMQAALDQAGMAPEQIGYLNAHGTSTVLNDKGETAAIKSVFGDYAYQLPVSSTKSMTGHLLGGAGAVEAIFCVLAMKEKILPPTINYEYPDPECDLNYVPNVARRAAVDVAMSNSFGFGGHNACLILRRTNSH
jgi:3-oxoacyl-[acyl-carrier-protein] synthase II